MSVITPSDVTAVKNVEEKVQKPVGEKPILDSEKETKCHVNEEQKTEVRESAVSEYPKKDAAIENISAEAGKKVIIAEAGNVETCPVKDLSAISSKTEDLEPGAFETSPATSPDLDPVSVLVEKTTSLLEKDASVLKEVVDENSQDQPNGDISIKQSPTEGEKQDEAETIKETTKKLSAAAPPFNPSTVSVFGSVPVPVPGYKDHGGILPPPVNIPPMLAVNPVRRSPHQSATARVPYGPRLSGGYNRSGNRVP
ncbi:hypothetical protein Dsin_008687 [Dipteronia sinensis]|uniref:Uncharacterized protein n=1 Tax=Dipteronia sinensis TaxID=43782 RepID=A0AAE0EBE2_9ROSI|nr:hypothetical protein Dsin_008687 [Dipteronia sinensis]